MKDRSKAIEEMAKILTQADENSYIHCGRTKSCKECKYHIGKFPCTQNCRAEALYNAGYCKVDEQTQEYLNYIPKMMKAFDKVRKETAREILHEVKQRICDREIEAERILRCIKFDELEEKFGVEVE